MVKKLILGIIALAIVFGAGYYVALMVKPADTTANSGPMYATKPVERGDIKVGVNITGQLNANWGGSVFAPQLMGVDQTLRYEVKEVFVKENDEVKKDDPVIRLEVTNLADITAESGSEVNKKYEEINSKIKALGQKINKNISSIYDVNPEQGIVITSPISGRITNMKISEGDKVTDALIGNIVNDGELKISFKATEVEFAKIQQGQKVLLNFSGYEGYYNGVISELNTNKVPNDDNKSFVYNGVIKATNPGLIKPEVKVAVSTNENGAPGITLYHGGVVESYGEQSSVYTTEISDGVKAIIASQVFVSNNQFVKAGDPIVRIAGKDVTESIQNEIDAIKALLEEVEGLRKSGTNLADFESRLLVKAPSDGIVSWVRYNVGDTFEANSTTNQWDLQVMDLFNSSMMSINTTVSDLDVNYVQQGATVEVTVDALPGKTFEGVVDRMYQFNENGNIAYNVNITVTGGEGLRPGMNTNCFIDAGESLNTLLIPIEAVFDGEFPNMVEVLKEDGTVEAVKIEIGLMNDRYVEVLSGLEEGQQVVTGSSGDLMPSQKVDGGNSFLPGTGK